MQAGILALLAIALPLVLGICKLPPRIDIARMANLYFVSTGLQSAAPLLGFYLIQRLQSLRPLCKRGLALLLVVLSAYLWWLDRGQANLFVAEISVAILGLVGYSKLGRERIELSRWLPVLYLFAGMVVVFSYLSVGSAMLNFSKFDRVFDASDRFLLLGYSVGDFSRWILAFPNMGDVLEGIYYGLFAVMGATLLWLVCEGGPGAALDYASDILTCYLITLLLYLAMPSIGPFIFSPSSAPLNTMQMQNVSAPYLSALQANHSLFSGLGSGYFVAFPCMHIVQSVLVAWHMRPWRRLFVALLAFNGILAVAILGLQWHYFTDLVGGLVVVFLSIRLRKIVDGKAA